MPLPVNGSRSSSGALAGSSVERGRKVIGDPDVADPQSAQLNTKPS